MSTIITTKRKLIGPGVPIPEAIEIELKNLNAAATNKKKHMKIIKKVLKTFFNLNKLQILK